MDYINDPSVRALAESFFVTPKTIRVAKQACAYIGHPSSDASIESKRLVSEIQDAVDDLDFSHVFSLIEELKYLDDYDAGILDAFDEVDTGMYNDDFRAHELIESFVSESDDRNLDVEGLTKELSKTYLWFDMPTS